MLRDTSAPPFRSWAQGTFISACADWRVETVHSVTGCADWRVETMETMWRLCTLRKRVKPGLEPLSPRARSGVMTSPHTNHTGANSWRCFIW